MDIPLKIKFSGDAAEQHRLPAFDAAESLDGIAKSLLIPMNYLAEGRVRHKSFKYSGYKVDLVSLGPGSVDALFQLALSPEAAKAFLDVGIGVTSGLVVEFVKAIYRRAVGQRAPDSIETLENNRQLNAGDLAALVDAVEPSVKRAHTIINNGAGNIAFVSGENNIVNFNPVTKRYVQTTLEDNTVRAKLVSVGGYNANSRYGRVFDYDLGKTVPFDLSPDVDLATVRTILDSIRDYALKNDKNDLASAIAVRYTTLTAADGRVKKMIVRKARKDLDQL